MKRIFSILFPVLLTAPALSAQKETTILPLPRKSMLGVYNTSSISIMPRMAPNNYYPYPYYGDMFSPYPYYNNTENRVAFSFRNTTGYRFFDFLNVGAGVGIERYETLALNLPFFGEVSGNILNRRFTPVYFVQAGYGLGIKTAPKGDEYYRVTGTKGGLMLAGGIGFAGRIDRNTILRLNFGYRLQQAAYTAEVQPYNSPMQVQTRSMSYHRLEMGISFTFQQ